MKQSSPLEIALAAEAFGAFYRRRGESLTGAMNRLLGNVTNTAPAAVRAAQREGKFVKGATWLEQTAEGMKRIVYLNKNAADISTVIHETSHAVAHDFTEAERRIAARALNGYELKNGTTVYFEEDGGPWTDEQHEAFAEALENYFTNGTAPNEQIKGLFERIKEFMKRIYQTMKGWTELSPQVEEFYQSLLSGELVDQARAEEASRTRQEARSGAQTEKTINDTIEAENATTAPQDTARAISPNATQSHIEPHTENDIISSPDIPLEEKAEAVLDAAGEALYQAGEAAALRKMAIMPRDAVTLTDAENIVKDEKTGFLNKPITNSLFNITATVSGRSLTEMTSAKLAKRAISPRLQAKAVANADVLFERAIIHVTHPDIHGRKEVEQAHRLGALMEDSGEYIPVMLTVVEYKDEKTGNRLYAIEAVDIEKMKSAGLVDVPSENSETSVPIADFNNKIIQLAEFVKPDSQITLFQAVYHGSPYRFDRFDSSHMGEGEGNQTFGWGHYFAGKKEVAEYYRETLSSRKGHFEEMDDKKFSGRTMAEWYRHWERRVFNKSPTETRPHFDRMAMIENLMINYDYKNTLKEARENEYTPEAIAWFEKTFEKEFQTPGQLYEVDIPGDDEMLDWDKPLNEQPEKIKKIKDQLITWEYDNESKTWKLPFAHAKITIYQFEDGYGFKGDMNKRRYNSLEEAKEEIINYFYSNAGAGIYNILTQRLGSKKAASQYLNSLGIKGIRYLDGESRNDGEGTHNYVIFDDNDINITQTLFQIRTEEPPKKTGIGYKVFYYKDGKLYPPMVNPDGQPTPVDVWLNADEGVKAGVSKTGRVKVKAGGKGTQGGGGTLAYRPGWHLGDIPRAKQFDRNKPTKNADGLFPKDFVWAEVEYAADNDYQKEAESYGVTANGSYRHAYAGLPRIPKDGYYRYRTNPNPETEPWIITGAMRVVRVLGDSEVNEILKKNGMTPVERQGGTKEVEDFPLIGNQRFNESLDILCQTEDRNMMEEAASFDSYEEWRSFTKKFDAPMGDYEYERWTFTEEQVDAWYKSFWENSKKAKEAEEKAQGVPKGETTPADIDREFKEIIPDKFKDFFENSKAWINEDFSQWGAVDEEDAAERERQAELTDDLRKKFNHTNWTTAFKKKYGELDEGHRKRLLGMIKNSPREYRAIYAVVMKDDYFAVSPEDFKAEILKNKITDSRRDKIDSMTPEQLRKLEEDIGVEEIARKLRTGTLKLDDPDVMAYIKRLNDEVKQKERELKEAEADREEDNKYLERAVGEEFLKAWERALKAKEEIGRTTEEFDRAIKDGERSAATIAWRKQRQAKASYTSVMETLEALNKIHNLELDIQEALGNEELKDYAKSAKTQSTLRKNTAFDKLNEEYKDFKKSARTQATLQKNLTKEEYKAFVKSARTQATLQKYTAIEKLKTHIAELKEKQKRAKELTQAMKEAKEEIFKPANPRSVNAEQGAAIATIQRFIKPSMLKGLDRFMDGVKKPILQEIFNRWKTDEKLRSESLEGKPSITQEKITRLFNKEKFDDLTNEDIKYLSEKLPPKDWAAEFGMQDITDIRNGSERIEAAKQNLQKNLPQDVYYRIMDKPLSEWTLNEAQELAGIISNLDALGRNIYKANIEAEQRRIREYQDAVKKTIRTVIKKGKAINDSDELEKIIGKYKGEDGGTAESDALRRKHSLINRYSNINVYRFARMLDNGDVNGKNMSALFRMEDDAFNQKMRMTDARQDRIYKVMADEKIKEGELWELGAKIDLGGDMGVRKFTKAELMGFLFASRNEYSREALLGGNLLTQKEQENYQVKGADADALEELSAGRYAKLEQAARKFIADNPQYQKLMDAIAQDLTVSGQRLAEYLVGYNNTIMPIVEFYFPMIRTAAVSADTADAKLARDLMGSSAGAFKLYVEKGFTEARHKIPIQYQTAIKLDILAVWSEAVSQQEHFMAYGQAVKDLNKIYKQSRSVRDAIHSRYGRAAVEYIDKYINEMANPNPEKTRSDLDKWVRLMRGNTAAAYLGWKTSSIVKQFITSPAPFFGYMNMAEYWGTFIEFTAHREDMWNQICELSPHMKHRSADMMQELVKEMAKQADNKAIAAMSKFNKMGMMGLEWIDRQCVAPGWMVLYRNETKRLTGDPANANLNEKDISVKAAQYADDIIRLTQPDSRLADLPPLFKGNSELGKAYLQFTQSLSNIYQQIRYDVPQQMRDKMFRRWAGTIIGYTIAGIMLGAITQGFDDDDDEEAKARKIAWWATTQFTDSIPIIGSDVTRKIERGFTGKARYQGSQTLIPAAAKLLQAVDTGIKAAQEKDFDKWFKAAATGAEAGELFVGLPVSGEKELEALFGIGDGDGELNLNPGALAGRR